MGIALIFGLSLDIVPALFAGVPWWIRPLFDSSLTPATVIAVVLNQALRGGQAPHDGGAPTGAPAAAD